MKVTLRPRNTKMLKTDDERETVFVYLALNTCSTEFFVFCLCKLTKQFR